jgi:hypothetical protein
MCLAICAKSDAQRARRADLWQRKTTCRGGKEGVGTGRARCAMNTHSADTAFSRAIGRRLEWLRLCRVRTTVARRRKPRVGGEAKEVDGCVARELQVGLRTLRMGGLRIVRLRGRRSLTRALHNSQTTYGSYTGTLNCSMSSGNTALEEFQASSPTSRPPRAIKTI